MEVLKLIPFDRFWIPADSQVFKTYIISLCHLSYHDSSQTAEVRRSRT